MSLVNTDIYNITESINDLTKRFIDNEDEETLALGMYGYITSLESKKIQTAIMMANELSNEVFPTKAKLDKNIITHAIFQNVIDINAVPSSMVVLLGIKESDLDKWMVNNKLVLDKYCTITVSDENEEEQYEFHLDYDIIITRSIAQDTNVYSAIYNMDRKNSLSDIDNPYLKQPYRLNINGVMYVFLQCKIRQVSILKSYRQLISSNIIDNKTFNFEFEDQLADFEIVVKENGKTYYLTPVFEGSGVDSNIEYYCSYMYINSNMIRVKFNSESYMPSLNAEITTIVKTTKGASAIFECIKSMIVNFTSETYGYDNINIKVTPNTKSLGGVDRKSIKELKNMLPKEAISRGSITTNADLDNYFNLINTEDNRLKLYKKVDNQIERIYYAYLLIKNNYGNIVPTNTISIEFTLDQLVKSSGRYIIPSGTLIKYDGKEFKGKIIDTKLYDKESEEKDIYYYMTLYSTIISINPLYISSVMYISDEYPYLTFEYINQQSTVQFISENIHLKRSLISNNNKYYIDFQTKQNINDDMGMIVLSDKKPYDIVDLNMRAFMVFYNSKDEPYRYKEIDFKDYNYDDYIYSWGIELETDNTFDIYNRIKILDLYIPNTMDRTYGYLDASTTTRIYLLAKFDRGYGLHDLSDIVPNLEDWTVTNMYEVHNGLHFFTDYSNITNAHIDINNNSLTLEGLPAIGYHYMYDEDNIFDFINQMSYKKMYIDNALDVLENSFEVDFKLFNTYGPSRLFTIDEDGKQSIGSVDITISFELGLKISTDIYTKQNIIEYVKDYIEDLNDLGSIHINNLLSDVREKYRSAINYFDFLGFNDYGGTYLHLYHQNLEQLDDKFIPPEFINIRNTINIETQEVTPNVNIITVNAKTSY